MFMFMFNKVYDLVVRKNNILVQDDFELYEKNLIKMDDDSTNNNKGIFKIK